MRSVSEGRETWMLGLNASPCPDCGAVPVAAVSRQVLPDGSPVAMVWHTPVACCAKRSRRRPVESAVDDAWDRAYWEGVK